MIKAYKKKRVKEKTPPKGLKVNQVDLSDQLLDDVDSLEVERYMKKCRKVK